MQKKAVDAYLQSEDFRYSDKTVFPATTSSAITGSAITNFYDIVNNYIAQDYPDIEFDKTKTELTVTDNNSQNVDGSANVTYRLKTLADAAGESAEIRKADTEKLTFKLLSDETKAKKAFTDAAEVVNEIDPSLIPGATVGAYQQNYYKKFGKEFAETYKKYLQNTLTPNTTGVYELDEVLYPNTTVTVEVLPVDASVDKDGKVKVIVTAVSGNAKATDTIDFTIDSIQTNLDKAAAAVEDALGTMTVTNNTTKDDVLAVVNKTLTDGGYGVKAELVTFDKKEATADKEGTIDINVLLTDTANGLTRNATATKKFTFLSNTFVEKDGKKFYYDKDGKLLKNTFLQGTESPDGYTYYIQNDGSVMQDRLTYHPDGEHVIYFDKDGHEVFDAFVNVKKDVQGQDVDYIGYFDTFGYAYVNKTTYGNGEGAYAKDALFYINDYGVLENKGWFGNAAGEIGYAAPNGTLTTSQWSLDQFGRKVYFQANGFLAKGLMTDGVKYYQLDETDGHLVGEF